MRREVDLPEIRLSDDTRGLLNCDLVVRPSNGTGNFAMIECFSLQDLPFMTSLAKTIRSKPD